MTESVTNALMKGHMVIAATQPEEILLLQG